MIVRLPCLFALFFGSLVLIQLTGMLGSQAAFAMTFSGDELFDFTLVSKENSINISWTVKSPNNVSHFILCYSVDGRKFTQLAEVEADYSVVQQTYSYSVIATSALNYFYITMVDIDGNTFDTSIKVCEAAAETLVIYPNPVKHDAKVMFNSKDRQVVVFSIYTTDGHLIRSFSRQVEKGFNQHQLQLSNVRPGHYILQLRLNGKQITKHLNNE